MFNFLTPPSADSVRWPAGVLLVAWLVSHAGCAGASGPAPVGVAAPTQIRQLIGDAVCSTDADCRTIAVGDKACGGPESYLAWSARQTDPQTLAAVAEQYTSERKAQNRQSGMVSNCAFVTDPGARCENEHHADQRLLLLRRPAFGPGQQHGAQQGGANGGHLHRDTAPPFCK